MQAHLRQLFADDVGILAVGDQYDVFGVYNRTYAVNSELQEAFACAEKVKKLLRAVVTAERPESGAYASAHYYAIAM